MSGSASPPGAGFFLIVQAWGRDFALPIGCARSVFRIEALTRTPLAPPWLLGLVNLHGRIVTVVCLNRRLRPDSPPLGAGSLAVAVELGRDLLALAVEDVGGVVEPQREDFLAEERAASVEPGGFALGALARVGTGRQLAAVLDVRALFELRTPTAA